MGACSLLERRIGMRAAEELILSGKMLSARKLHEMGVVDVLAPNGQGESTLRSWIATNAKRRNGMQAMFRARQFVRPVTRQELDGIVELWVDAALRLGEREMKMMSRLARAQAERMEHEHASRDSGRRRAARRASRHGGLRRRSSFGAAGIELREQARPQRRAHRAPEEAEMADAPHLRIGRCEHQMLR